MLTLAMITLADEKKTYFSDKKTKKQKKQKKLVKVTTTYL